MMHFDILSVFPEVFAPYLDASIMGRAQKAGIFDFTAHDLRKWTHDRHHSVDDAPFGGGQGMLMKPAPIFEAVRDIASQASAKPYTVFFSPAGKPYTQKVAERLSAQERILFVCGRYEGMDERCYELADESISLGDYVLTGGELAALVVIDSIVRLLPGALGDEMSSRDESFSEGLLEYAQYTRPADFEGRLVPEVLLSGDHAAVAGWRRKSSLERTATMREDLLANVSLSAEEQAFIEDIRAHKKASGIQSGKKGEDEDSSHHTSSAVLEYVWTILGALALAFVLKTFVFNVFTVPTGSMLNTIQEGDLLVGEKVTLLWDQPKRGDVVTFRSPADEETLLVKRVIATAGQTVDLRDGAVYVDGEKLDEPYTEGKPSTSLASQPGAKITDYPYTVPDGCIFVMGDNRTNSLDSRFFGPVPLKNVTTKTLFIFWPINHARGL